MDVDSNILNESRKPLFFKRIEGKRTCIHCLKDPGLKKFAIEQIAPNQLECSYCGRVAQTIPVGELQDYIMRFFPYGLSVDEQDWEDGEYWGENHDDWDMRLGIAVPGAT